MVMSSNSNDLTPGTNCINYFYFFLCVCEQILKKRKLRGGMFSLPHSLRVQPILTGKVGWEQL